MQKEMLIKFFVEKAIDSFLLAIELYNKPTKKYKLEGLLFHICNVWELVLKAEMLKKDLSIYYKDNPSRTLSLGDCVKKVMTNSNDPVRKNLDIIISLRNTSTHFIIPEYENSFLKYVVFNVDALIEKFSRYHSIDINSYFSSDFISLLIPNTKTNDLELINNEYGKEVAQNILKKIEEYENCASESNAPIAATVEVRYRKVSKNSNADITYAYDSSASNGAIEIEKY